MNATTKATVRWLAAACCGLLITGGLPSPSNAQTVLERLESRIRGQTPPANSSDSAGQSNQPTLAPRRGAVPPPVPQPPTSAASEMANRRSAGRTYLGIMADDQNDRGRGIRVLRVYPDGPGSKAGLREDDLIVSLGGIGVHHMTDFADVLDLYKPGDKVSLEVLRGRQSKKLEIVLGQRPPVLDSSSPPANPTTSDVPAPSGVPTPPSTSAEKPKEEVPIRTVPPPPLPPPPSDGPALVPPPATDSTKQPATDAARIDELLRRIEQLEKRIEELERKK